MTTEKPFNSAGLLEPGEEFPDQSVACFLNAKLPRDGLSRWLHLGEFLWNHGYRFSKLRDDTVNLEDVRPFRTEAELDYLLDQHFWTAGVFEAHRIADNQPVMLKAMHTTSHELDILRSFSQFRHDPRFHGIPLLDDLTVSDAIHIGVTPLWTYNWLQPYRIREYDDISIEIVLELAKQILEFLVLLHAHSITHGDLHSGNILRDPNTLTSEYNFALIDFGVGHRFEPTDPLPHTIKACRGAVRNAPELSKQTVYDPYKLDVHRFGSMIDSMLSSKEIKHVPDSLHDWIYDMTYPDPIERLSAEEALANFMDIRAELGMPDLEPKPKITSKLPTISDKNIANTQYGP